MPRVNIWLPDELHKQVKAMEVPVSHVCQQALTDEVASRQHQRIAQDIQSGRVTPTNRRA